MKEHENNRVYEFSYLLTSSIPEDKVTEKVGKLKGEIEKNGGEILAEEQAEFIPLAYEMSRTIENKKVRFTHAYFGWVKFEGEPEILAILKEIFDRDEEIIRHLTIKTVRENTMAPKKLTQVKATDKRKMNPDTITANSPLPAGSEESVITEEVLPEVSTTEEVDQKIDEMVAEA